IAFERIAIEEGLRAATGVASVIALAVWLDRPALAPAAFGAFQTCLADPGGSYRARLGVMGLFASAGAVSALIASAAAGVSPLAAAAALVPLVFLPSLGRMYGTEASRVGTLLCVVAAVAVANPRPPEAALQLAGLFFGGGVWAVVLCIGIWRIQHFAPARRSIGAAFGELEAMAAGLLPAESGGAPPEVDWDAFNAEHRRRIRETIEKARGVVAVLETADPRYRVDIETADQIFAALIAIGHGLAERRPQADLVPERLVVARLRRAVAEAQRQVTRREPDPALLFSEARVLQQESSRLASLSGRGTAVAATALIQLCESWRNPRRFTAAEDAEPGTAAVYRPIPRTALTHATRVAIAVVIAYGIGSWLNLTFSYWATMAAVVVVQPEATSAWQRSIERMAGTMAGGLLAAGLMFVLPAKLALLALIFPIAAATIAFRLVNYTIFVVFLTTLFVLVTDLLQPVAGIASVRVLNNVIGSLVGLGASVLPWRSQKRSGADTVTAEAVRANLAYAAAVLAVSPSAAELERLRRAAGLASNAAEAMQHTMLLAGQSGRAGLEERAHLLHALRRLAGSVIAASLGTRPADSARAAALIREGKALADAIAARSAAQLSTVAGTEPRDDVDEALRSVTVAAAAYLDALPARSSTLVHAAH
ncbi:MAG: FUSC family protein, partial [Gammaproteobacteria bacterium]|nr:FUSC family protein [Gammaproteobacteria bacterium]